jgi:UDP-N-acetylmuramyl pentapeptide synthase
MAGKHAVFLGDMNELGASSVSEHQHLGRMIYESGVDLVVFCGEKMRDAHEQCPDSHHFNQTKDAIPFLQQLNLDGFTLLIKGSRSMQLEQLYTIL